MGAIEGGLSWGRPLVLGRLVLAARRLLSWQFLAFLSLLTGVYIFVAVITLTGEPGVFTSPDETGNYIITEAFGDTGKLYYERDYFAEDDLGLAHPRSLLRYNDRVVLPNSQGLPLFYGAGYAVFGSNVTLVALLLAPLCLFFLYETAALLMKRRSLLMAIAFFGLGPLLYWFSRPYWNSLGATTFFAGGIYCATRYYYSSRRADLLWAAALFSISMLFRYEYVAFVPPFMAIVALQKHGVARWRHAARELALFGGVTIALFLLPLIAMSLYIFHEPIVFPTALLGESVTNDSGTHGVMGVISLAWSAVLPEGFDPLLVGRNLLRFTFVLTPGLTLLSLAGLALALRSRALRLAQIAPLGALLVYYVFFVGSVDSTYLASGWDISFEASIVRYWLLLYVVMYFFAVYFLLGVPALLRTIWPSVSPRFAAAAPYALGFVLAASTLPVVWYGWQGSLDYVYDGREIGENWHDLVVGETEPNAVVYTSGDLTKYFASERNVMILPEAAADDEVLAAALAFNMGRVMRYRPVYFIDLGAALRDGNVYLPQLRQAMAERGLSLEPVEFFERVNRVVRDDPAER
ncbi:MAG: hypothetical protein WEB04_02245 [Dehalococcoidia bacterium]